MVPSDQRADFRIGALTTLVGIPADDNSLVAAAQAGDRGALDTLLRRHYDRVYALCRRMAGNDADALDATQEALMAIVRGLGRFDGRAAFGTWAYRVATNACLDELRRRSRRPRPGLPGDDTGEPGRGAAWTGGPGPPRGPDVDDEVAGRMDLDAALAHLPEEFRAAVVLRDVCQLDYAEIAEVLGVPSGTVRSRIARGRAAVGRLLAGNLDAAGDRPTTAP